MHLSCTENTHYFELSQQTLVAFIIQWSCPYAVLTITECTILVYLSAYSFCSPAHAHSCHGIGLSCNSNLCFGRLSVSSLWVWYCRLYCLLLIRKCSSSVLFFSSSNSLIKQNIFCFVFCCHSVFSLILVDFLLCTFHSACGAPQFPSFASPIPSLHGSFFIYLLQIDIAHHDAYVILYF